MQKVITNKLTDQSTADIFEQLADKAKKIVIAVAFFSNSNVINHMLEKGKQVSLIVSLRPPTNYYSLKEILHKGNLEVFFLGDDFHSKIFAFYDDSEEMFCSMIGSSNFTNGGFKNNIETNVILTDHELLTQIDESLRGLNLLATKLQPDILNQYKKRYDNYLNFEKQNKSTVRIKKPSTNKKIPKKVSEYFEFWKIADKVKDLVKDISQSEYPSVPKYLVIDHFWHWVVIICDKERLKFLKSDLNLRDKMIPLLFKEYCGWDKSSIKFTAKMEKRSKSIQKLLSKNNIHKLSKQDALSIFRSFHATQSLIQRFGADEKFIKENSIKNIRQSFNYLQDETLPIDYRIHSLNHPESKYKLKQFGLSCIQELVGWANPNEMPIRNNKADMAVQLLGFRE